MGQLLFDDFVIETAELLDEAETADEGYKIACDLGKKIGARTINICLFNQDGTDIEWLRSNAEEELIHEYITSGAAARDPVNQHALKSDDVIIGKMEDFGALIENADKLTTMILDAGYRHCLSQPFSNRKGQRGLVSFWSEKPVELGTSEAGTRAARLLGLMLRERTLAG